MDTDTLVLLLLLPRPTLGDIALLWVVLVTVVVLCRGRGEP